MKLTRTDDVFSRTTMVLFLCRNRSSRNGTKLFGELLCNKRKILEPRTTGGGPLGEHNPPGAPRWVVPTWWPTNPNSNSLNTYFWRKNREEVSSRFVIQSHRHLLFFIGRPDLESVWGTKEGNLQSLSSPTLLHRQFHDAPHRE